MKALVVGRGVSGSSVFNLLKNKGFDVSYAKDEDVNDGTMISQKEYADRLFSGLSFVVVSPGVSLDKKIIVEAKRRKIEVVGELEFASRFISSDILAVTGTNGKTTTVMLINYILAGSDKRVFLGGNTGVALSSFATKTRKNDIVIVECSSFQLESVKKFHPHIATILNISEDHLSRHKTMKNYIRSKMKITKNQIERDYLLLNFDSEELMENIPKTKAKIMYFSTKHKVVGCYIKRGSIYFNDGLSEKRLVSIKNIQLPGEHNLSNIVCAVLAVYLETGETALLSRISAFQGVEHRIEFVKKINGVMFYNDSKATNIDSTLTAVKCFKEKINLILGGSEKGYGFDKLFECMPKNVKMIAVFGQTKQKIISSAQKYNFENYVKCDSLRDCITQCIKNAKPGEIVLLSPACASFDHFSNYVERGNVFKKIVREMSDNEDNILFENKK